MHIPDGYLAPAFSVGMAALAVPAWTLAVRRVQRVLNHRTVPLLAIFSAVTFTIMLFNIPVPGGTTAHGVGGTLIAIVLGPWAAVIAVSTALIIQALFFGDGGVLAIFANCFNMGVLLPFVGYWSYRAIAGRSSVLSTRRVWAAGIGAYLGITAAAVAVGFELGIQPLLFNNDGLAIYSPYPLEAAIPAMLLTHLAGASLVEGLITAFGLAYLQRHHPEYLTSLRGVVSGPHVSVDQTDRRPVWPVLAIGGGLTLVILLGAGLLASDGDLSHLFGADWSQVDWAGVAGMLLVVAILAAVLIPLAWVALPRSIKGVGTAFVAAAVLAPLGLIAPGFAFGEGSADDVGTAFGYVPQGLQDLSELFSAPFKDYTLPFIGDVGQPLWKVAIGYEISGIVGVLLLGSIVYGLAWLLRRREGTTVPDGASPA